MRNLIDIPNHPAIPTVTRKAQVRLTENNYENSTATMVLNVFHFIGGVELKDMFKQIQIVATNTMIDPVTFEYVESGGVGEFDTLYSILESKAKTQFELEEMFISLRINEINGKLYN